MSPSSSRVAARHLIRLAARVLFLLGKRYLVWTGSGFQFDAAALAADFGITPSEIPA